MASWGKTDYKKLKELEQRLAQLENADWEQAIRQVANEIAQILLNKVKKRTLPGKPPKLEGPKTQKVEGASGKSKTFLTKKGAIMEKYWSGYTGGTLRDAWEILPIERQGDQYVITILNPTEYASYVEYGHRQTPGRYVPALGKTLKDSWVKGKFMLTMSIQEVEALTPALLEKALYQCLKECFDA